ncbi:hypothetical protein LCGC14_1930460 [marine sediment metagenome]|uniref:Uncharacterized protein n=1 Tax=marine sediment metagenome TaxID=412755 RepID=A0A0F9GBL2_9ZZZZ
MRDIGLTRTEAEKQMETHWATFQKLYLKHEKLQKQEGMYTSSPEMMDADRAKLEALRRYNPIKDSGIVPWLKSDGLGSLDPELELWAARVLLRDYEYTEDYRPVIVVTTQGRGAVQHMQLDKDGAEHLRDQLAYELDRWEEE